MPGKFHRTTSVFDKALNIEAAKNYRLSIRFSTDGFSFCVLDTTRNKYSGLEVYEILDADSPADLTKTCEQLIASSPWLGADFQAVKIIYDTPQYTLIPKPLFSTGDAESYYEFNFKPAGGEVVRHDHLPNLDAVGVYAFPGEVIRFAEHHFPGSPLYHTSSSLIENLLIDNKNRDEKETVFAHVKRSSFDIVVLNGRNLLFFNTFTYQTKEDFAYYLIYVIEQLGLNPEKTGLELSGDVLKISDIYDITFKYVRNVDFMKRSEDYAFSYVFDEIPSHFHYPLINLQRCEL